MEKEGKIRFLIKNTGILTIGSFASKVLVFLLVPFYTGILTTAEYGLYDLSITVIQLMVPILSLDIIDSILRFTLDKSYKIDDVINGSVRYITISIAIFTFLVFLCRILNVFPAYTDYYIYICLYYIAYLANQFFLQVAKGINNLKAIAISGIIGTLSLAICCIVFLKYTGMGLKGFYLANVIGQTVPAIYYFISLRIPGKLKRLRFGADAELEKKMRQYSIPLILTTVGWWVNTSSDKFIITLLCGASANGLLAIAYKIPNILSVFAGIFNQAWQISAIREFENEKSTHFYNNVFEFVIGLTMIGAVFLIFINKGLSRLMFANEFYNAWRYVPLLIISSVMNTASGMLAPILSAQYKTKPIALSSVIGLTVNLVLNYFLALILDIQGVVIATAIASFLICLIRYITVKEFFEAEMILRICIALALAIVLSVVQIMGGPVLIQAMILAVTLFLLRRPVIKIVKLSFGMISKHKK